MTDVIDKVHFQELADRDPREVCRRALCRYDDAGKYYELSIWGDDYRVFPHQCKIDCLNRHGRTHHQYFFLFIIHYLLSAKPTEFTGIWISEKDMPGGPTFFRGPHQIPTRWIARRFANNVDAFKMRCAKLQGTPIDMADAAYAFTVAPRIPAAVLYWSGDDEFPAEAKILYDQNVTCHFALDIIYALAVGICNRLGERPGETL